MGKTNVFKDFTGYLSGNKSIITLLFCASSAMFSQYSDAATSGKPNVLFILTDDLGYGDLSCQGGKDIHTPNIDQLFNNGVKFSNFYASCTVCSPTRASLMTGRYPDMVGVPGLVRGNKTDNWGYLLPSAITLPDMLKKAGYQTAIIGKWNLGLETPNLPNERGFDFFHGFLSDMMDDYWTHLREGINYMRKNQTEINPKGHATEIFSDWAIEYVTERSGDKKPFFLYLAYNAPHFPIQPPNEWLEKVKKREGSIDEKRAKNIALVEHLDYNIGRVIEALKKSGQYENTVILFSSDNGGHLPSGASNGNLRGGKQDMYEGGIKVPTCMVWEGTVDKGVSTQFALTMDLFPTLCSIAGVPVTHTIDGINLMAGILRKSKEDNDNRMVYFMRREGGSYGGLCYYAARKGAYKLVQNTPFEEFQLFNIESDPLETKPLDVNMEQFKELKFGLSQHIRKAGAIPWEKPEAN
ncbi:MAG TPA: N-acetylgalactosamine 6-sulfate sulfatase [Marinilabiliales bacterium]|nr:N-acetylgalactosamine 6-sulfate sulfatase [Marinilabiliales bacterium]